jgi:hypothetical protein
MIWFSKKNSSNFDEKKHGIVAFGGVAVPNSRKSVHGVCPMGK